MSLFCIECFHREGKFVEAMFVVNGQSMCQTHVHFAIVDPGQPPKHYSWVPEGIPYNPSNEPLLVDEGRQVVGPDAALR